MTLPDAKELLGLDDDYTLQEAKSARNRLAKRYHPDVNKSPQAEETLKQINEAYQLLVDSYDAEQASMRERRAAEQEHERRKRAAEEERVRREAEQDRARQAAEREQHEHQQGYENDKWTADRKWAAEQEWYGSQEWADQQARNEEREWQAQQEWYAQQEQQRREAERQWRRRTEEAERDRAEQSRRQRERWEAMQTQQRERERREADRYARKQEKLEQDYLRASEAALNAKTSAEHSKVAAQFKAIGNYRDSQSRSDFHSAIAQEKSELERTEEAKEQEVLRKLNFLPTLTMTAASAAGTVLAYVNGGISGLIASVLYCGAVLMPLTGIGELIMAAKGKMKYGKDGNMGQICICYSVPMVIVAVATRSPAWAFLAIAQLSGGISYTRKVTTNRRRLIKTVSALVSLAALIGFCCWMFTG